MFAFWWVPILLGLVLAATAVVCRRPRKKTALNDGLSCAKTRFHIQREHLEAKFLQLVADRIGMDEHDWDGCSFGDDVAYVRNRGNGELSALVAVTLDDYCRGDGPRTGTAIFRFDDDHWETDGRTMLNLPPVEAMHFLRDELEIVEEEIAHPLM